MKHEKLIKPVEDFLREYVSYADDSYPLPLALWVAATHCWQQFDSFPYVVITAATRQSGKTRTAEVMSFATANPRMFAGMTVATLFNSITNDKPTIFFDEAEILSGESADTMRAVLNVGYRKGQSIPRMTQSGVKEFDTYCPKVFILIGDVNDTLRDRSIIVMMRRAEAPKRFIYDIAKAQGSDLRTDLAEAIKPLQDEIRAEYVKVVTEGIRHLGGRDEEIWSPIYALCRVLCPSRMEELVRCSTDICTLKTIQKRVYSADEMAKAEADAENQEYSIRLLRDLWAVLGDDRRITSTEALQRLYAHPTGPWRKFRGRGLTSIEMAGLLGIFPVNPVTIRVKSKGGRKVAWEAGTASTAKGYKREDIERALKYLNGPY